MGDKLEVLAGPGLVTRYGDVAAWAGPQASPALQAHLVGEAQRASQVANGGDQFASSLIAVLQRGDPEPQAPFAVVGPGANGLTLFLHGPVQAWDSGRWLAPQPVPGWMVTSIGRPWPLIVLPYGATPPPQSQQGNPLDLVFGAVPGSGFVLLRPPAGPGQQVAAAPQTAGPLDSGPLNLRRGLTARQEASRPRLGPVLPVGWRPRVGWLPAASRAQLAQPGWAQLPVEQPPVEQAPVEQPPVEQPPVEQLALPELAPGWSAPLRRGPRLGRLRLEQQWQVALKQPPGRAQWGRAQWGRAQCGARACWRGGWPDPTGRGRVARDRRSTWCGPRARGRPSPSFLRPPLYLARDRVPLVRRPAEASSTSATFSPLGKPRSRSLPPGASRLRLTYQTCLASAASWGISTTLGH